MSIMIIMSIMTIMTIMIIMAIMMIMSIMASVGLSCSSLPAETLNVSCQYHQSAESLTCGWSLHPEGHAEPAVSFIFSRYLLTTRPLLDASSRSRAHVCEDLRLSLFSFLFPFSSCSANGSSTPVRASSTRCPGSP